MEEITSQCRDTGFPGVGVGVTNPRREIPTYYLA